MFILYRFGLVQYVFFLKNQYNQYIKSDVRLLLLLIFTIMGLGVVYSVINAWITQYPGNFYIPSLWLKLIPVMFVLTIFGFYVEEHSPRMAYFTRSYGLFFFSLLAVGVLTNGVQYTPFAPIDHLLIAMDQAIGFNTVATLNWVYAKPQLVNWLCYSYNSLYVLFFLVPLLLAILTEKKAMQCYFISTMIAYIISTTLYYFFPTVAPAGIFDNPHFMSYQHATSLKFYQIHHHLHVTTSQGGMIAFPSIHVILAVLLTYVSHCRKWLFYPTAIISSAIIVSTVLLGWHYLVDVFGGLLVALIAIVIAKYTAR